MTGISQSQISRYEKGDNDPTGEALIHLSRSLDVSADWLLGLTDNMKAPIRSIADLSAIEREALEILRSKSPEELQKAVAVLKVL